MRIENRINPLKRSGDRRSILAVEQKETIISWVNDDHTITLKKLVQRVEDHMRLNIDDNIVNRVLKGFHYTLKQVVSIPERRNMPSVIETRYNYAVYFNELLFSKPDSSFVFLDEVGFNVVSRTSRGRSLVGSTPIIPTTATRARNISVIASANKYGMISYHINNAPVSGEDFKTFLIGLNGECIRRGNSNPVFILDNARIHHYRGLCNVIDELSLNLLFLPPYSPFLNIIENWFAKWKNYVLRGQARNEDELQVLINSGFNSIENSDCEGYFRKMLRCIERCRCREEFNE